jgi:hypothetical protein
MRRSALIGPWGVGAIVPFPNDESLMIAGLDMWRYNDPSPFVIKDERLQKRIGVSELRWPPDYRELNADSKNAFLKIPTVRFPTWYYCPFCGSMRKTSLYEAQPECDCYPWENGRKCDPKKRRKKMIPERFIVVCPEGHIDDFPIAEWLHQDSGHKYDPDTCHIRRSTGGSSSSLTGVTYECTCGAKKSLAGATTPGALNKRIGYKCKGSKPWLGITADSSDQCGETDVKVLLRGATNVWFADTRSSIRIPTDDEEINKKIKAVVDEFSDQIISNRVDGKLNRDLINSLAILKSVNADLLYSAFQKRCDGIEADDSITEDISEDEYRVAEYKVLIKDSGSAGSDFHSINIPIFKYNQVIHRYFKSISLVPQLKETRAFIGFSRLEPNSKPIEEEKKSLRLGNEDWVPAIEVYGEGIFFEFNHEWMSQWSQIKNVQNRLLPLRKALKNSFLGEGLDGELCPEYLLIHTFAHLIINQLSYECGYGSSSIRERIYCEKTGNKLGMNGVLIYTASGDSEGSLGGLVRQGKPGRLEDTIVHAIQNAEWCASDPICIQSLGQGPESCNLAACHNCALLPETCCENGNRLLDRGVIIGTLDNPDIGYFKELKKRG